MRAWLAVRLEQIGTMLAALAVAIASSIVTDDPYQPRCRVCTMPIETEKLSDPWVCRKCVLPEREARAIFEALERRSAS